MLWLAFACLSVLVLVALTWPLFGRVSVADGAAEDVFAAQLTEVDADLARGVLSPAEAGAARTEVARRLLRAHRSGTATAAVRRPRLVAAVIVALFVPAVAVAGYLALGAPGYADQPLASRRPPDAATLATFVESAETRIAAVPDDGEAWARVAPLYLQLGRFDDAAKAFETAALLVGESGDLLAGRAQALTLAAGGTVTDVAHDLFLRAETLLPEAESPRVFLAIAARQRGDFPDAARRWRALLEASDGTEPWLPVANAEIARIAQTSGFTQAPAAAAAPPPEQQAMIEGMVAGLAARLEADGGSAEEWARLVRSYRVLGREDDARAAAQEALTKLPEADRPAFAAADGIVDLVR